MFPSKFERLKMWDRFNTPLLACFKLLQTHTPTDTNTEREKEKEKEIKFIVSSQNTYATKD